MASSATFALNSAVNRLRVFMMVRPSHRRIHLNRLSQEPGPALYQPVNKLSSGGLRWITVTDYGDTWTDYGGLRADYGDTCIIRITRITGDYGGITGGITVVGLRGLRGITVTHA